MTDTAPRPRGRSDLSAAQEAIAGARAASRGWAFDEASPFPLAFEPRRRAPRPVGGGTRPTHGDRPGLDEALAAIEDRDAELRAFAAVDPQPAGTGPVASVKDVLHVDGFPTLAGSAAYESPGVAEGSAVARLRAAGYRFIGKTETHEFALGVTTPQSRNPHDPTRLAGGSSGGSAVAVASGMCVLSIGTDTRASIRVPASLCGVVGFKPSIGSIPGDGIVQLSWTMDHLAVLAATVADAALAMDAMSGRTDADAWRGHVAGLRVGFPPAVLAACDPDVVEGVGLGLEALARSGVEVVEVTRPDLDDLEVANHAGMLVSRAEAITWHTHRGTALERCIPEVGDQLRAAREITASEYLSAQRLRRRLADEMLSVAEREDLAAWILPTTPCSAPLATDYEQYLTRLSLTAILWSFVGYPAMSVPAPVPGMPVGLQLVATPGEDHVLVALGSALEQQGVGAPGPGGP